MLLLMKSSMYIHCYDLKVLSHKVTCCRDKITYMTHDATLQHIACNTPVLPKGTDNELTIKMTLQGRPTIGLFTELSQRHVASACHTMGRNERGIFLLQRPMNSNIWIHVTHVAASNCIKTYMSHEVTSHWAMLQQQVTSCDRNLSLHIPHWYRFPADPSWIWWCQTIALIQGNMFSGSVLFRKGHEGINETKMVEYTPIFHNGPPKMGQKGQINPKPAVSHPTERETRYCCLAL